MDDEFVFMMCLLGLYDLKASLEERRRNVRYLEWVFLLSFIPSLILPFIWQNRFLPSITLGLPIFFGVLHGLFEGWRVQMTPLYLLAFFSLMIYLLSMNRVKSHRNHFIGAAIKTSFLIGCGLLAGWLLPVVMLPTPTGLYPVGVIDRELVDKKRDRRLMVSVWYPAAQSGQSTPMIQFPEAVISGLAKSFGAPEAALLLQHLRYFTVSAGANAPLRASDGPHPVLVFSHGLVGLRFQNSSTLQELASYGYVIVAIDHTDAAAVTAFPDGETRLYNLERFGIRPADIGRFTQMLLPFWVADQKFVYDVLEQWAVNDPIFARKLDLTRMASFGHSFGGATAIRFCQLEKRCQAAVNIDGGLDDIILKSSMTRPTLLLTSTDSHRLEYAVKKWFRLMKNTTAPKYWIELLGSDHYSFTIIPLLSPVLAPRGFDVRAGLKTTDKYLRAFFDFHLRAIKTTLLSPASGATDVRWHSK